MMIFPTYNCVRIDKYSFLNKLTIKAIIIHNISHNFIQDNSYALCRYKNVYINAGNVCNYVNICTISIVYYCSCCLLLY